MRAAAAYNKPSNRLEPSPISSPDSFILTVLTGLHPLPLTLPALSVFCEGTAAKDTQARGAQVHDAWAKAQAPNRNQSAAAGRPGTHLPPKMALNRPSFLIDNPELEIELSYTKQKLASISNRQFFAFSKLPDASLRVSPRHAERLRRARPASRKSLRTAENSERLIGNDMHSPASATALQCATSIFLIGNEFRFAKCEFSAHFRATAKAASSRRTPKKKSPTLTNRAWGTPASVHPARPNAGREARRAVPIAYPERFREGRASPVYPDAGRARTRFSLQEVGASAPTKERCQFFFLSRVSSARRVHASWTGLNFRHSFFEFRFSIFGISTE